MALGKGRKRRELQRKKMPVAIFRLPFVDMGTLLCPVHSSTNQRATHLWCTGGKYYRQSNVLRSDV